MALDKEREDRVCGMTVFYYLTVITESSYKRADSQPLF